MFSKPGDKGRRDNLWGKKFRDKARERGRKEGWIMRKKG